MKVICFNDYLLCYGFIFVLYKATEIMAGHLEVFLWRAENMKVQSECYNKVKRKLFVG